jgi:metallophosphoesterase (TIGR00282 family)
MGLTTKDYNQLKKLNIDVITMGNHTWGKRDIFSFIDESNIIRPANYSEGLCGKGYMIVEKLGKKVCVINLIGRTDMGVLSDNPFTCIDKIINNLKDQVDYFVVDFHAEATAEKIAMRYYLDGRVSMLFGTHTHVQTADEQILEKGTGYITDLGMTGPKNSVIGMNIDSSLKRFTTSIPERYRVAEGPCILNGIIFDVDENGRTTKIYRIDL